MTEQDGMLFTAKDRDNDEDSSNCAASKRGGWWYKTCPSANLNGIYGDTALGKGINWPSWKGLEHSMKYTAMMVKPGN